MPTIPLGLFSRDRFDWQIEAMMLGCAAVTASSNSPRLGLANAGSLGLPLALYAVCAKTGKPFCDLNLSLTQSPDAAATVASNNLYTSPIVIGSSAIDGYLTATSVAPSTTPNPGIAFRASGENWFCLPYGPLMVIPVGWAANLMMDIFGAGNAEANVELAASFVWSYYVQAKSSIQLRQISAAAAAAANTQG